MDFNSKKEPLEHRFSFFKKNTINKQVKLKLIDNLIIGALFLSVASFSTHSINQYETLSKSFQEKTVDPYTPIIPANNKDFLIKNSSETLINYLAKKDVSYEDMDKSIETVKANQKNLPNYLVPHIVDKLKSDNTKLYQFYMQQIKDDYFSVMNLGIPGFMLGQNIKQKNQIKFKSSMAIYDNNFEKIDTKINNLLQPIEKTKDSQYKKPNFSIKEIK